MSDKAILPGATIGVLGSGQLGRMLTLVARRMGYRVATLSPETGTPTGQVSDIEICAAYDDLDAVRDFARRVDVVTFEFENVPVSTALAVETAVPLRPSGDALHITQHRLREKQFLAGLGVPHAPYHHIKSLADLRDALAALQSPAVLKTAGYGYDGKGQVRIQTDLDAEPAWEAINGEECVLEKFIAFDREVSVVAVRGLDGSFAHYGVVENWHTHHILDVSVAPASVSLRTAAECIEITQTICEALELVGVLCVEFFVTHGGDVMVNEIAPRPHNSGHWTIEGCVTSQFEQQLRAVCGLPLGSVERVRPASAMANLLGDLWPENGSPNWSAALTDPEVKLHLYGKDEARPGRKMGHLTATASTPADAVARVRSARSALTHR
jgi:5-(carboxyamino)imidazole ribonucleotide synthase